MTAAFTAAIDQFLGGHHVMSLATAAQGELWAASVFYSFDPPGRRLLYATDLGTAHGRLALANPQTVGTVSTQERDVSMLQGIQLRGRAVPLQEAEAVRAGALFAETFPGLGLRTMQLWALTPTYIKMVDNTAGFGHKEEWPKVSADRTAAEDRRGPRRGVRSRSRTLQARS